MQFTTTFATLVAVLSATLSAATPVVEARQETLWCGKQPYVKGDVCYLITYLELPMPIFWSGTDRLIIGSHK